MLKIGKYSVPYLILLYLLLWILLFEIILPVNNILPKPSIVLISFADLIQNYQLGWNYLSTLFAIYLPTLLAYFICKFLFPVILQKNVLSDIILSLGWFSRYIPGIILAMILIYWFPQSEFAKYIFAFLISFTAFVFKTKYFAENISSEYSLALRSFGIGTNLISRKVIWKAIQPDLFGRIIKLNIYLWASIIFFEYANLGLGIGTVLRKILQFKDLSALVMMFIIIGVSIFMSAQLFKFIKNQFYSWKV